MITFLFWNIKNNPIQSIIARLALRHEVDVIMLAEYNIEVDKLLSELNNLTGSMYYHVSKIGCERIEIFTRFPIEFITPILESDKYTICHLKLPNAVDILLSVAHLKSKSRIEKVDQDSISEDFSESIKEAEKDIGHLRTVVFGDLNMSPFDGGVIKARGLNATMSRFIAQKKLREVRDKYYPFFYNPMWNFLGDFNSDPSVPPGTYYYVKSTEEDIRWYILDQVLLRPEILTYFNIKDLMILTSDGSDSFLTKNGIPKKSTSDHLPLILKLNLNYITRR
jgi:hypothetical protein